MDELDKKIIDALEKEGYQKSSALSSALGVSQRTILRRMHYLLSNNVIKVFIRTNMMLLGYKHRIRAGIKVEPGHQTDLASRLSEHPSIHFLTECCGRFNFIIGAGFKNMSELVSFINLEIPSIPGVQSMETFYTVWPRKYFHFYWPPEERVANGDIRVNDYDETDYYELSELDRSILNIMIQDALIRPAALSKKLNISETKIRNRIRKMLDNQVFKREVMVNPELTEYGWPITQCGSHSHDE